MLDYDIIASGSSGNCVVIENIMIDCGIPYTQLKDYLYDVDYLIITHIHGDHLKESTFKSIKKYFPNITTIANWQVSQRLSGEIDIVIDQGDALEVGEYTFEAFEAIHDVVNSGYCWQVEKDDETYDIIYCTDSTDYRYAPDRKYDYMFIESNYDENVINAIKKPRKKYGYDVVRNARRHSSEQKARAFYYHHRKDKDSKFIELHCSQRFHSKDL